MHARMKHPMFILPDAMKAMHALHKSTREVGISEVTLELVCGRCGKWWIRKSNATLHQCTLLE